MSKIPPRSLEPPPRLTDEHRRLHDAWRRVEDFPYMTDQAVEEFETTLGEFCEPGWEADDYWRLTSEATAMLLDVWEIEDARESAITVIPR